jgi:hypothetical protein
MLSRAFYPKQRGRRWLTGLAILSLLTSTFVVSSTALADLDRTLFELDKNAQNDITTSRLGTLGAQISNATTTSIKVCRTGTEPATPFTILVDAERLRVTAGSDGYSGGGCSATKRTYTVTRGANGTTAAGHASGENVTLLNVDANGDPIGTVSGDDWDQVYAEVLDDPETKCADLTGAVECTWVHDGRAASIFTSSKDYDEIEDWQWRDQSVPDADELDDGFAVKYSDGDQELFFGSDRFATNGSKDAGFWFFHDTVAAIPPANGGDGTFTGAHTEPDPGDDGFCNSASGGSVPGGQATPNCAPYDDNDRGGDILILTTFTNGGAVTTIRVFEWFGPAGSDAALFQRGAAGDCVPGDPSQDLCATVNDTTVESPWPYSGKGEPQADAINAGGLMEGGINLSDFGLEGCFSSFMATTRSAPSITADPKDFILGSFEACESDLTTTPADAGGTPLTDGDDDDTLPEAQLGTGAAGVDVTDSASITVNGTNTWSGSLETFICGPIETGTCDTGGVSVGSADVDSDDPQPFVSASANLTEVGRYCWRGEFTSDDAEVPGDTDASDGECFEVLPVQPTLDTVAWSSGDDTGSAQTDPVPFGSPVYDKATLSGTAYQPGTDGADTTYPSINATMDTPANGSITFTLVGPGDCTTTATGTGTNPETGVTVTGDGDYFSSGFTPDLPGDYHWQATYTGDSPNTLAASHNDGNDGSAACSDADEDVTVQQLQPTMDTAQSFIPNDSATITVDAGTGPLDGQVTFYLWVDDATCGGGDLGTADQTFGPFDVDAADVGTDPLTDTVETANTTAYGDDGTTFDWVAVFTSDNNAHLGVTSGCGNENSSISIDNGVTQPATP